MRTVTVSRGTPARTAPVLLVTMAGFQGALAAGAPWGGACYGGKYPGHLPWMLRLSSASSVPVYLGSAVALASPRTGPRLRRITAGVLGLVGAGGAVINALSPSPAERLWSLWSVALTVSVLPHALPREF